jgi:cell wall-associated NlpC family hydrolase
MMSRAAIVAEARTWVDTPWKHQGRLKGVGVDCGGLIIGVGQALGLLDFTVKPQYGRQPNWRELEAILREHLDSQPFAGVKPGDILAFAFIGEPQHLGICTGDGLIHSYAQARKVVEHRLDDVWLERLRSIWTYREAEPG